MTMTFGWSVEPDFCRDPASAAKSSIPGNRSRGGCLLAALLVSAASPVFGGSQHYRYAPSASELPTLVKLIESHPIAVGCDLADCWPAQAEPTELDWRIRFKGDAFQGLHLASLDPSISFQELDIDGDVESTNGGVSVGTGDTTIHGLPTSADGDGMQGPRAPLIIPTPHWTDVQEMEIGEPLVGSIIIDQMFGNQIVSTWNLELSIDPPQGPLGGFPQDSIIPKAPTLTDPPPDAPVVFADLPRIGECNDDKKWVGFAPPPYDDRVFVGNASPVLIPNKYCASEVSVFSTNYAMSYEQNVPWTTQSDDVHEVTLKPMIEVHVNVWLAWTEPATCSANPSAEPCWEHDFEQLNKVFKENRVGIQFVPHDQAINLTNANPTGININEFSSCAHAENIQKSNWYKPGRLNVYYVDEAVIDAEESTGKDCSNSVRADPNIIIIGNAKNSKTLAHEIGHAFGLRGGANDGHINFYTGGVFNSKNIMTSGGNNTRDYFSLGQVFRMNVHPGSMLNVNCDPIGSPNNATGCERTGPTRYCAPGQVDSTCPVLWFGPPQPAQTSP